MVRRDYFSRDDAESLLYAGADYKSLMLAAGIPRLDAYDTCCELLVLFSEAARKGGYDIDLSDYEIEIPLDFIAHAVSDSYVFGIEPFEHLLLSDVACCGIGQFEFDRRVDFNEFLDCCVEGGILENLDAWLNNVPLRYLLPDHNILPGDFNYGRIRAERDA